MTGQSAKITVRCACGGDAVRTVNQFVDRDELWWDSEFSCTSCGTQMCEHAGPGAAPDDVRAAMLAAHGPVTLRLGGPVPSRVAVLKVLRELSAMSLHQATEMADELSREGLAGTPAEMEFLRSRLQARGVPVDLDR